MKTELKKIESKRNDALNYDKNLAVAPLGLGFTIDGQEPAFQDRIDNPQDHGVILNNDGSRSTHRMAAEYDADGKAWAFPMIVEQDTGSGPFLHEFDNPRDALDWNKANGNAIPFDTIEDADQYSRNYKTDAFNEYYEPHDESLDSTYQTPKSKPLPEHAMYKHPGQDMNPDDAFVGGAEAFNEGLRKAPGDLMQYFNEQTYAPSFMEANKETNGEMLRDTLYDITGVNPAFESDRPWQHITEFTGNLIPDMLAGGVAKGGKRLVDEGIDAYRRTTKGPELKIPQLIDDPKVPRASPPTNSLTAQGTPWGAAIPTSADEIARIEAQLAKQQRYPETMSERLGRDLNWD